MARGTDYVMYMKYTDVPMLTKIQMKNLGRIGLLSFLLPSYYISTAFRMC